MVFLHLLYISTFTWSATSGAVVLTKSIPYTEESPPQNDNLIGGTKEEAVSSVTTNDEIYSKFFECGVSKVSNEGGARRSPRIINGREAFEGEFPWMASIYFPSQPQTTSHHNCGGSIIGPRHILSAAHCFDTWIVEADLTVLVGGHSQEKTDNSRVQKLKVKRIIRHDNYTRPVRDDIAILILEEEIKWSNYRRMICLPSEEFLFGNVNAKAAGWGHTWGDDPFVYVSSNSNNPHKFTGSQSDYWNSSPVLKATNLTIINNTECNERYYGEISRIEDARMCAGASYLTGDKIPGDTSSGDSGGPLMVLENERWTVVGITSMDHKLLDPTPGIYTRVSEYLPWIRKHLQED